MITKKLKQITATIATVALLASAMSSAAAYPTACAPGEAKGPESGGADGGGVLEWTDSTGCSGPTCTQGSCDI